MQLLNNGTLTLEFDDFRIESGHVQELSVENDGFFGIRMELYLPQGYTIYKEEKTYADGSRR